MKSLVRTLAIALVILIGMWVLSRFATPTAIENGHSSGDVALRTFGSETSPAAENPRNVVGTETATPAGSPATDREEAARASGEVAGSNTRTAAVDGDSKHSVRIKSRTLDRVLVGRKRSACEAAFKQRRETHRF